MTKLIIQIAVHVPFRGGYRDFEGVKPSTDVGEELFEALKVNFGLRSPLDYLSEIRTELRKFVGTPDDCFKCAIRALRINGTLKSLKLVLPTEFRAATKNLARCDSINPDTVIHRRKTEYYLHSLRRLRNAIPGLEIPVVVRTNAEDVIKAGGFEQRTLADRKIMEVLRDYGILFAPVYVDSLEWDLDQVKTVISAKPFKPHD